MINRWDAFRIGIVVFLAGETAYLFWNYVHGVDVDLPILIFTLGHCPCCFLLILIYASFGQKFYISLAFILSIVGVAALLLAYAGLYSRNGIINGPTQLLSKDPIDCLYFSIVTFTTLGYGDFYPKPEMRLFTASEALVGYFALAALIALFSRLWVHLTAKTLN